MTKASPRGPFLLHWFCVTGAALGNEGCFITLIPLMFFAWDMCTARRVVLIWTANYYLGQALKDLIALPRPRVSTLVARLETHYQAEYGMPSTHAMNAWCMPWFIVYLAWGRVHPAWLPGMLLLAVAWTTATTMSRLYMGVHTPADLWVGSALGLVTLALGIALHDAVDAFLLHSPWVPLVLPPLALALVAIYPRPAHWVNSPGDSTIAVAAGTGVALSCWWQAPAHLAACEAPITPQPPGEFLACLPLYLAGLGIILLGRSLVKAVTLPLVRAVLDSATYAAVTGWPGPTAVAAREAKAPAGPPAKGGDAAPPTASGLLKVELDGCGGLPEVDADAKAAAFRASPGAPYAFRYDLELSVKVMVYFFVGVNATATAIVMLQVAGIDRYGYQLPAILAA